MTCYCIAAGAAAADYVTDPASLRTGSLDSSSHQLPRHRAMRTSLEFGIASTEPLQA